MLKKNNEDLVYEELIAPNMATSAIVGLSADVRITIENSGKKKYVVRLYEIEEKNNLQRAKEALMKNE